ncbi:MAG: OmpA family protein [Bacteroidales bacterium]|nr:OmpA family protein [Bacteroidales bacterium]
MANKVRVYGKAQNRTALGIMHAYMVMYPQATMDDLKKAFPDELNPDSGVKKNFVKAGEKGTDANWDGFFQKEDELLTMGDGSKVAVVKMWTKPSFERLVSHALQYGIEIAQFEAAEKGIGQKGSFRLEYLNGYVPPKREVKKSIPWWVWAIIGVVVVGLIIALLCRPKPNEKIVEVEKVVEVEKIITVTDTVYLQQLEAIEENFNAAQFEQGKAVLNEDAKFVLHDLAKLMNRYPEMRLRIEGHTSAEGNADLNQKLSEARAQAAVTFLIEHGGIDASRLEAVGFGSSKPKNADNPMSPENRRTEFEIIQ